REAPMTACRAPRRRPPPRCVARKSPNRSDGPSPAALNTASPQSYRHFFSQLPHRDAERFEHPNASVATGVDLKDRVIGVDPADAAQSGQRIRALRNSFAVPSFVNRFIITNTSFAPMARSMAPPTAG